MDQQSPWEQEQACGGERGGECSEAASDSRSPVDTCVVTGGGLPMECARAWGSRNHGRTLGRMGRWTQETPAGTSSPGGGPCMDRRPRANVTVTWDGSGQKAMEEVAAAGDGAASVG
jgi:hypothetical protein